VSCLAQKAGHDPVLFPELYGLDTQTEQLAPAESTPDQHPENRVIPIATERIAVRTRQKPLALFRGEPVPDTNPNPADSFDQPDPGREFRTEQTGIGGLIRDPSHGGRAQVDRSRCVLLLFEIDSLSQDDGAVECEARFRAAPLHEIGDGAAVGPLAALGRKAVPDGRF